MKKIILLFSLILMITLGACAKEEAPIFTDAAYTVKEVGTASMVPSDVDSSEPYAYDVTLNGEFSGNARVVLPYIKVDAGYGTKAREQFDEICVFLVDGDKETNIGGRYVRAFEGVEIFTNTSGRYVVKKVSTSIEGNDPQVSAFRALVSRNALDAARLDSTDKVTWDEAGGALSELLHIDPAWITTQKGYKKGKEISLQDAARVIYNKLGEIREFPQHKTKTMLKASKDAIDALSTFDEMDVLPKLAAKSSLNIRDFSLLLASAYFQPGRIFDNTLEEVSVNQAEFSLITGLEQSTDWQVFVDGKPVSCQTVLDLSVARFGAKGEADIKLVASKNITGLTISPLTLGIVPTIDKNTVSFKMTSPAKLYIRTGGLDNLVIFSEDMSAADPYLYGEGKTINLSESALDNTGKTDLTEKLQQILDDAASQKATVIIPNGTYLTRRLMVPSGSRIYFEPSAFLWHMTDFEKAKKLGNTNQTGLLEIRDVEDVKIWGYGGIWGEGAPKREINENYRPRNFYMVNASDVTLNGISSFDAGSWNTHAYESDHILIDNLKVLNNINAQTADSIDIDSSNYVEVKNCFARGEDDTIVLKTTAFWDDSITASPTHTVSIHNNICYSGAGALKFGTENRAEKSYGVVFKDNYVIRGDNAIQLTNHNRSYLYDVKFLNTYVEYSYSFTNKRRQDIYLEVANKDDGGSAIGEHANIYDVLIDGLYVRTAAYSPNKIEGYDKNRRVYNVTISNYFVGGQKITSDNFRVNTNEFAEFEVK